MADRRYGTTTQQGYGSQHQQLRARLAPVVALGTTPCVRCGLLIRPGQAWDLGHVDGSGKREHAGPEHTSCNRSAGAKLRNTRALDPAPQPMTAW